MFPGGVRERVRQILHCGLNDTGRIGCGGGQRLEATAGSFASLLNDKQRASNGNGESNGDGNSRFLRFAPE